MPKKYLRIFTLSMLVLQSARAQFYLSGEWQYILEDNFAVIVGYSGAGGDVIFPATLESIPVQSVGDNSSKIFGTDWGIENTSIKSIIISEGITRIGNYAFMFCQGLTNVSLPSTLTSIGIQSFYHCGKLTNIVIPQNVTNIQDSAFRESGLQAITLPQKFLADSSMLGLKGEAAANNLVLSLATVLATNFIFINNLAQAVLTASNNYGLATQTNTQTAITAATASLATKNELTNALVQSRADGINSVLSNPNLWTLYTTNQIKSMAIGDLVLTRTNNGQFILNYDIEQSEDLANWTPYAGFAMPLTNLPTDKAFVRIKLKNSQ